MTNSITPPDKQLVRKWIEDWAGGQMKGPVTDDQLIVAAESARWGADMELEACVAWLDGYEREGWAAQELRAARRPQPPTLKEQAMRVLVENGTNLDGRMELDSTDIDTIRRALEALDD